MKIQCDKILFLENTVFLDLIPREYSVSKILSGKQFHVCRGLPPAMETTTL